MTVIEVWLRQRNLEVEGFIVHEDEHTEALEPNSASLRGAMRTVTKMFSDLGFTPVGRWETTATWSEAPVEVMRRFRK